MEGHVRRLVDADRSRLSGRAATPGFRLRPGSRASRRARVDGTGRSPVCQSFLSSRSRADRTNPGVMGRSLQAMSRASRKDETSCRWASCFPIYWKGICHPSMRALLSSFQPIVGPLGFRVAGLRLSPSGCLGRGSGGFGSSDGQRLEPFLKGSYLPFQVGRPFAGRGRFFP